MFFFCLSVLLTVAAVLSWVWTLLQLFFGALYTRRSAKRWTGWVVLSAGLSVVAFVSVYWMLRTY